MDHPKSREAATTPVAAGSSSITTQPTEPPLKPSNAILTPCGLSLADEITWDRDQTQLAIRRTIAYLDEQAAAHVYTCEASYKRSDETAQAAHPPCFRGTIIGARPDGPLVAAGPCEHAACGRPLSEHGEPPYPCPEPTSSPGEGDADLWQGHSAQWWYERWLGTEGQRNTLYSKCNDLASKWVTIEQHNEVVTRADKLYERLGKSHDREAALKDSYHEDLAKLAASEARCAQLADVLSGVEAALLECDWLNEGERLEPSVVALCEARSVLAKELGQVKAELAAERVQANQWLADKHDAEAIAARLREELEASRNEMAVREAKWKSRLAEVADLSAELASAKSELAWERGWDLHRKAEAQAVVEAAREWERTRPDTAEEHAAERKLALALVRTELARDHVGRAEDELAREARRDAVVDAAREVVRRYSERDILHQPLHRALTALDAGEPVSGADELGGAEPAGERAITLDSTWRHAISGTLISVLNADEGTVCVSWQNKEERRRIWTIGAFRRNFTHVSDVTDYPPEMKA